MNTYETLFICPPDLPTEKVDEILERVKRAISREGGQIQKQDRWGIRRLAYAIRGHREGFYVHVQFAAPPSVAGALEQTFRVLEGVLRHTVLRVEAAPARTPEARARDRVASGVSGGTAGARAGPTGGDGGQASTGSGGQERPFGRGGRHGSGPPGPRSSSGGRITRRTHTPSPSPLPPDARGEEPKGGPST